MDEDLNRLGSIGHATAPQVGRGEQGLAHLRCGDAYARLAAGFGMGIATVYRCVREVIEAPVRLGALPDTG